MSKTDGLLVNKQLDYSKKGNAHTNYRWLRLLPQSGGQTVTITPTAIQETLIEIPTNVFNLAQSYITYDYTVALTAAAYSWIHQDCCTPHISQIELYPRSGQYLAQCYDIPNYLKVATKAEMSVQELMQMDDLNILQPSNLPCTLNYRPTVNAAVSSSNINNTEPLYLKVSALGADMTTIRVQIPMSIFKNTIFALDKNIAFNDVLVMRILWGPGQKSGYTGTSNVNPVSGAANTLVNTDVKNLTFWNAVEQDADLVAAMKAKVQSGYSLVIPYLNRQKLNAGAQTTTTATYRLNASHGITLNRIYTVPYNNTENKNTAYDNDNTPVVVGTSSLKVQSLYTAINGQRIQDVNVDCTAYQDWQFMQRKLKNSVVQGKNVYSYNWFWRDDFDGKNPVLNQYHHDDEANIVSGIALTNVETRYDFNALSIGNAGAALNIYMYAVCQKVMTVTPNLITCM